MLLPPSLACRYYSGKNNFHLSRHLSSHSLRVKEGKYASPLFEKVHCPHKLCSATKQLWTGPKKIRKCKSTRLSPENPAEDENCREHGVEAASLLRHLWRETSPEVSYSSSWLSSSISSSILPLSISLSSVNPWDTGYILILLRRKNTLHMWADYLQSLTGSSYWPWLTRCLHFALWCDCLFELENPIWTFIAHLDREFIGPVWAKVDVQIELWGPEAWYDLGSATHRSHHSLQHSHCDITTLQ